jgi:hypothetical protein
MANLLLPVLLIPVANLPPVSSVPYRNEQECDADGIGLDASIKTQLLDDDLSYL